ncbi:unnamed protein product [Didymodactylos carnosus]|uniref:t-SNARE coiled-coil homology domain-containing protein n=1 Tax=Didymodactylos carnosus TaxID=1234261 RepID=A0A813X9L5_9BILA|nr:unnamed protein product [Didymodactylos carnosus]CAF3654808.1 unnamed protein product [Didymodactylos carnosus]
MALKKSYHIESFLNLKNDIEKSFIKIEQLYAQTSKDDNELENLFKNIAWNLEDLEKLNQLPQNNNDDELSQSHHKEIEDENVSLPILDDKISNEFDEEAEDKTLLKREFTHPLETINNRSSKPKQHSIFFYSKENSEPFLLKKTNILNTNFSSSNERIDYVKRMRIRLNYYKNEMMKQENMDIVNLSPSLSTSLSSSRDAILKTQDEQLNTIHSTVLSLKHLTQNINFELDGHVQVLNNLDQNMVHNQNNIEQLTKQTNYFVRNKSDPIAHTLLTILAIVLFFIIIILLLFF